MQRARLAAYSLEARCCSSLPPVLTSGPQGLVGNKPVLTEQLTERGYLKRKAKR